MNEANENLALNMDDSVYKDFGSPEFASLIKQSSDFYRYK